MAMKFVKRRDITEDPDCFRKLKTKLIACLKKRSYGLCNNPIT